MVKTAAEWFRETHCKKCDDESHCTMHMATCIEAEKLRLLTKMYDEGDF